MPSLGETYESSTGGVDREQFVVAVKVFGGGIIGGLALVWALRAGFGAIGVDNGAATLGATAVAGLAVPFVGAGLLRGMRSPRPARLLGAAGVMFATIAVAAYIVTSPDDGGLGSVPTFVLATYAVGALLALSSPVVATATESQASASRPPTSFVRNRRSIRTENRTPADGGTEEQELAFLLDTDEK